MPDLIVIEPTPIDDSVIALLEDALERARQGGIMAVAIATLSPDGKTGDGWSSAPRHSALIGAVAILQSRMIADQAEDNE